MSKPAVWTHGYDLSMNVSQQAPYTCLQKHQISYFISNYLNPWGRVLLEKLTGPQSTSQEIPRILWKRKVH